jgi:hypothetical protein
MYPQRTEALSAYTRFQNAIAGDRERGAPLPPQRAENARRGPRVRAQDRLP